MSIQSIIQQDEKGAIYIDYTQLAQYFYDTRSILVGDRWFEYEGGRYNLVTYYKTHPMLDRLTGILTQYADRVPETSTLRTRLMKLPMWEKANALSSADSHFRSQYSADAGDPGS